MEQKANIEAKAKEKFFSLYIGQKVWCFEQSITEVTPITIHYSEPSNYLALRSVKQLTDEECKVISKLLDVDYSVYNENSHFDKEGFIEFVEALFTEEPGCFIDYYRASIMLQLTDYLRSIGILLSFTTLTSGEVKTYSEEEIIQNGWCKMAEN